MSENYLGALESELTTRSAERPLAGHVDQRVLFPHAGRLRLDSRALMLGGWQEVPRERVTAVRLAFTEVYPRSRAAGIRGNSASLGLFGSLGKPLVLSLSDSEPVYLLIGFRWLTGINKAREWAPLLREWLAEGRRS